MTDYSPKVAFPWPFPMALPLDRDGTLVKQKPVPLLRLVVHVRIRLFPNLGTRHVHSRSRVGITICGHRLDFVTPKGMQRIGLGQHHHTMVVSVSR